MTLTQDQYSELKNKIVVAVPEIMEFKLGCLYEWGRGGKILTNTDLYRDLEYKCSCGKGWLAGAAFTAYRCGYCKKKFSHPNTRTPYYCVSCAREHEKCQYCKAHLKIIGRPITLADVLRAACFVDAPLLIDEYGNFCEGYSDDNKMISTWDLSKSLDDQSDATKQFLHDLLCKPNN